MRMQPIEFIQHWKKEFAARGFMIIEYDWNDSVFEIEGHGIMGMISVPHHSFPYGGALLADTTATFNKWSQCPFRYKLWTNYGNVRHVDWDFLLGQLAILAANPDEAARNFGGGGSIILWEE